MKTPVVIRDDYVMYLEWFNSFLWFHTDVFKWNKTIKKEFTKDLNTLQSLLPLPLKAMVKEDQQKLAKFGETVGWYKEQQMILNDGSTAFMYSYKVADSWSK